MELTVTMAAPLRWLWVTALAACSAGSAIDVTPGEAPDETDGKADGAAVAQAELKVSIDAGSIHHARSKLGLRDDKSEQRDVWFYDTPTLDLYATGLILRARDVHGGTDDSTVKLRPFTKSDLPSALRSLSGVKCEIDQTPAHASSACSLKVSPDEGLIDDVADGDRHVAALFSSVQEDMYALDASSISLAPLGPIPARVWTVHTHALPAALTAELWDLPDGQMLELSMRVDAIDADDAMADLLDFIAGRDLELDADQESKTKHALEAFAPQ